MIRGLLRNQVPILPVQPDAPVDVVPVDVAARGLAALLDDGVPGGEYWLTSGAGRAAGDHARRHLRARRRGGWGCPRTRRGS